MPGGYDAILCYNTSPVLMNGPALAAGKKFKAPVSSYVLDIWPENLYSVLPVKNKLLRGIAQAVSDWNYRRADRLIAMSSGLRERLLQRTGKQPESVAVIPQYCEDHYAVPQCEAALAAQYEPYFNLAFAGNFSPAQSLDTVLYALKLANERRQAGQKPLHLLLVGDGMSRAALDAHHSGSAHAVSMRLLPEEEVRALMAPYLDVDVVISDDRMYQVCGVKRA